jgi:hypothetical protein
MVDLEVNPMPNKARRAMPASERSDAPTVVMEVVKALVEIYIPIIKAQDEQQIVTGVVLQPNTVDAHGDIISEAVIEKAANNFLAKYNNTTELGEQHKVFKGQFDLYQSYIAPVAFKLNGKKIKKGSWLMVAKVKKTEDWQRVKKGKLTGFSIGGIAKVKQLKK